MALVQCQPLLWPYLCATALNHIVVGRRKGRIAAVATPKSLPTMAFTMPTSCSVFHSPFALHLSLTRLRTLPHKSRHQLPHTLPHSFLEKSFPLTLLPCRSPIVCPCIHPPLCHSPRLWRYLLHTLDQCLGIAVSNSQTLFSGPDSTTQPHLLCCCSSLPCPPCHSHYLIPFLALRSLTPLPLHSLTHHHRHPHPPTSGPCPSLAHVPFYSLTSLSLGMSVAYLRMPSPLALLDSASAK